MWCFFQLIRSLCGFYFIFCWTINIYIEIFTWKMNVKNSGNIYGEMRNMKHTSITVAPKVMELKKRHMRSNWAYDNSSSLVLFIRDVQQKNYELSFIFSSSFCFRWRFVWVWRKGLRLCVGWWQSGVASQAGFTRMLNLR